MLWKKTWEPEPVLMLAGGVLGALFAGNIAVELLIRAGVAGFKTVDAPGSVLLGTLSFHGAAIMAGFLFLKWHGIGWRDVAGLATMRWWRQLLFSLFVLVVVVPVMIDLKCASDMVLFKLNWAVNDERAVELVQNAQSVALQIYLGFFAVILAPVAEEFVFRGVLFSGAKKLGWPKCGWILVSLLFALVHANLSALLPLFVFGLALTWLYETTEGLLAPVLAHSLFNAANLALLLFSDHLLPASK